MCTQSLIIMSIGRDLEKQFQETHSEDAKRAGISELLGITAKNMGDTIIDDLATMIKKGFREALEGYVLCLSRIIKHSIAWKCIGEAFGKTGEKIPQKYYELFGQDPSKIPERKGFIVE